MPEFRIPRSFLYNNNALALYTGFSVSFLFFLSVSFANCPALSDACQASSISLISSPSLIGPARTHRRVRSSQTIIKPSRAQRQKRASKSRKTLFTCPAHLLNAFSILARWIRPVAAIFAPIIDYKRLFIEVLAKTAYQRAIFDLEATARATRIQTLKEDAIRKSKAATHLDLARQRLIAGNWRLNLPILQHTVAERIIVEKSWQVPIAWRNQYTVKSALAESECTCLTQDDEDDLEVKNSLSDWGLSEALLARYDLHIPICNSCSNFTHFPRQKHIRIAVGKVRTGPDGQRYSEAENERAKLWVQALEYQSHQRGKKAREAMRNIMRSLSFDHTKYGVQLSLSPCKTVSASPVVSWALPSHVQHRISKMKTTVF